MRPRSGWLLAAGAYGGLWVLTARFGPGTVESRLQSRLEGRWRTPLHRAESVAAGRSQYPYYAVRSLSPVPFLLYSEYGSGIAPRAEEGGHSLFVWVFGWSGRIWSTVTWVT